MIKCGLVLVILYGSYLRSLKCYVVQLNLFFGFIYFLKVKLDMDVFCDLEFIKQSNFENIQNYRLCNVYFKLKNELKKCKICYVGFFNYGFFIFKVLIFFQEVRFSQ